MTVDAQVRADVLDVLARFAHGIDGRDWGLYRDVFCDEVDVDYSSYRPGSVGRLPAQAWVDRARRLFPGLDASVHSLTNAWVSCDGDDVVVRTAVRADHFLDGARFTLGGRYLHRLRRQAGGWRIAGVTLTRTWEEGDRDLLVTAVARAVQA